MQNETEKHPKLSYDKPFLSYEQQLTLLEDRGMPCKDPEAGRLALRRIGYYRLSGYVYPFRKIKPKHEKTTVTNYRFDEVVSGHFLEDAISLGRVS